MTARRTGGSTCGAALSVVLAVLALGCTAPPLPSPRAEETAVKVRGGLGAGAAGPIAMSKLHRIRLSSDDGRKLDGVVIKVGGATAIVRDGTVTLTEADMAAARKLGSLVVIGAGFLPQTIPLDEGLPDQLSLTPTEQVGKRGVVGPGGGTVGSADDRAMVMIPAAMLTGTGTPVSVGTYRPREGAALGISVTVDGSVQAGSLTVAIDLAKLLRGWDGQGTPPWETDPANWTEAQRADAAAAAQILAKFRELDASGDAGGRQRLRTQSGIALDGMILTVPVKLAQMAVVDGLARVETATADVLGLRLELTLLSATAGGAGALSDAVPVTPGEIPLSLIQSRLPGYLDPPALKTANGSLSPDNGPDAVFPLISNDDGKLQLIDPKTQAAVSPSTLLTNNGGTFISADTGEISLATGGALIADKGGGLVANNSGGLVAGNTAGLISNNAGSFIGNNAGGLVGSNGTGLVSTNGAGLIANNGGQLTGFPYFPFEPLIEKYQLLQLGIPTASRVRETTTGLVEYLWPRQTKIRAIMADGTPLTDFVVTGSSGEFLLTLPPKVPIVFFLQAEMLIPDEDGTTRRAYALAFAPGKDRLSLVSVDASTSMIASSTVHLIDYIPPEYQRLSGLVADYAQAAKELAKDFPGVDLNKASAGGRKPYVLSATTVPPEDPAEAAARAKMAEFAKALDALQDRVGELGGAWKAFNPFYYGVDLYGADQVVTLKAAQKVSAADTLRKAYDPMYEFATAGQLKPGSYRAINPDSPPVPPPPEF